MLMFKPLLTFFTILIYVKRKKMQQILHEHRSFILWTLQSLFRLSLQVCVCCTRECCAPNKGAEQQTDIFSISVVYQTKQMRSLLKKLVIQNYPRVSTLTKPFHSTTPCSVFCETCALESYIIVYCAHTPVNRNESFCMDSLQFHCSEEQNRKNNLTAFSILLTDIKDYAFFSSIASPLPPLMLQLYNMCQSLSPAFMLVDIRLHSFYILLDA